MTPTVLVRFSTFSSLFFLVYTFDECVRCASDITPYPYSSLRERTVWGRKTHRFPSLTPPPENLLTGYLSPFLLLFCFLFVAFPPVCVEKIGSFSNGDGSEHVTCKMNSRLFKLRWKCQMKAKFSGIDFLGTALKFKKTKKNSSWPVYFLYKTCF